VAVPAVLSSVFDNHLGTISSQTLRLNLMANKNSKTTFEFLPCVFN